MNALAYPGKIETIDSVKLYNFPPSKLDGTNRQILNQALKLGKNELVLDEKQFPGIYDSSSLTGYFVKKPEFAIGRKQSIHSLEFGQLVISSEFDQEIPTHIAVKPYLKDYHYFETPEKSLVHEWAANYHVGLLTTYERSFLPLGIWRDSKDTPQLITLFDESVQSFDNIFWGLKNNQQESSEKKISMALGQSMFGLGILHGGGLAHDDPQIKNFARDQKRLRFIDLETLRRLAVNLAGIVINCEDNRKLIFDSKAEKEEDLSDMETLARSLIGPQSSGNAKINRFFPMVARVILDSDGVDDAGKCYYAGVRQGNRYSGYIMEHGVLPDRLDLRKIFKEAVEVRE